MTSPRCVSVITQFSLVKTPYYHSLQRFTHYSFLCVKNKDVSQVQEEYKEKEKDRHHEVQSDHHCTSSTGGIHVHSDCVTVSQQPVDHPHGFHSKELLKQMHCSAPVQQCSLQIQRLGSTPDSLHCPLLHQQVPHCENSSAEDWQSLELQSL